VNLGFSLHALAAWRMPHQRKARCCRAAGKPAIRARCSKTNLANSQTADFAVIRFSHFADAAFARSRGDGCLAVQQNSPKLPFKRVNRAGSQTDLSLHVA